MNKNEKLARYSLSRIKGITPIRFLEIEANWPRIYEYCLKNNIKIESLADSELSTFSVLGEESYPTLLSKINDPPIVLYKLGNLESVPTKSIAVVGTRDASNYGIKVAQKIVADYVAMGYTIVSGMAYGIDTVVHNECLYRGGTTIAVLGGNVKKPYPAANRELYQRIQQKGCVLSEFNYDIGYEKFTFARRNRIIAGLVQKVFVVEAKVKSGAMISAKYAVDYNRDLVAVPGSVFDENSQGCHFLIKNNMAEIYFPEFGAKPLEHLTDKDNLIVSTIKEGGKKLDDLQEKVYMSRPELMNRLMRLELDGVIAKDLFDRYSVLS